MSASKNKKGTLPPQRIHKNMYEHLHSEEDGESSESKSTPTMSTEVSDQAVKVHPTTKQGDHQYNNGTAEASTGTPTKPSAPMEVEDPSDTSTSLGISSLEAPTATPGVEGPSDPTTPAVAESMDLPKDQPSEPIERIMAVEASKAEDSDISTFNPNTNPDQHQVTSQSLPPIMQKSTKGTSNSNGSSQTHEEPAALMSATISPGEDIPKALAPTLLEGTRPSSSVTAPIKAFATPAQQQLESHRKSRKAQKAKESELEEPIFENEGTQTERNVKNMREQADFIDEYKEVTESRRRLMRAEFALEDFQEELSSIRDKYHADMDRQANKIKAQCQDDMEKLQQRITGVIDGAFGDKDKFQALTSEVKQLKKERDEAIADSLAKADVLRTTQNTLRIEHASNADLKAQLAISDKHKMEFLKAASGKEELVQQLLQQNKNLTDTLDSAASSDILKQLMAAKAEAFDNGGIIKLLIRSKNRLIEESSVKIIALQEESSVSIQALQEALDSANTEITQLKIWADTGAAHRGYGRGRGYRS